MKHSIIAKTLLSGLAILAGAQMASAQTITTNLAAPPGTVNTNIPGVKMRIVQGNSTTQPTAAAPAEALISGKILDPTTGLPLNNATPNPVDGSYFYNIDRYINMHEQIPNNPDAAGGNFFTGITPAAPPHNIPDEAEPGIPGVTLSGDYFAMEFTGWLQLPAGTVRFGVNSDDGFKLTIGSGINPRVQALQLIILDGTRGFGNTEANITVNAAGLYPFRLLFWEVGGANSGVELYTFAPGATSGNRYLINDTNQGPNSIRSYRELVGNPPSVLNFSPALTAYVDPRGNAGAVPAAPYMYADLLDGSTRVNTNGISFRLDGTLLATNITQAGSVTTVAAQSPLLVANSVHTNTLIFADSAGTFYTNIWTFTVGNYPTIPPAYALASADTNKPGFKAKAYQIPVNKNPSTGLVPNAERQIAGGYIDPATGLAYANSVSPTWTHADGSTIDPVGADGFFVMPGVINLLEGAPAGAGGNFSINSTPPIADETVPGIPGTGGSSDFYVMSFETILELKAGAYRLGVNSDDGFRLSAGRAPGDVVGIQLGTAGDRGLTDSYVDFVAGANGLFPFRLMYWETGGGAGVEFFVVDLATGNKTLINDLTGFTPIKAYRESVASRPYISKVLPTVNYAFAFADEDVIIEITGGANPLVAGSIVLTINGVAQTITAATANNITTVTRDSSLANLLPSGANNVSLVYGFTENGTNNLVTNTWAFTVPAYTWPIPAANKVTAAQVSGDGFHVTGYQIDRSLDANQGNGGRHTGNNMPGPETELIGGYINPTNNLPFPNLLLTGSYALNNPPNPDGSWDVPLVLNFNNAGGGAAANSGIFNGDTQVPGHPGAGTSNSGLDNSVNEFTTYLDLKAGAYIFGLNVDDGWVCSSAPNPHDTLGTLLGFRNGPGGNAGNPLQNPNGAFNVIVPEDGIYPFRILFFEGGGGVNVEFLSLDRQTGTQILVNDVSGQFPSTTGSSGQLISPIKAYNTNSGAVRPWVKFSVYPMPYIGVTSPLVNASNAVTLWQNRDQQSGPGPITRKLGFLNGSWNSGEVWNSSTSQLPFGDSVGAIVADLGAGSVGMILDGVSVTPTVTAIPNSTDKLVLYTPPAPLGSGSNHIAGLVYAGTTNYWLFRVIATVSVPSGIALPPSQADLSARGFLAKVVQSATVRPGANTGNSVASAEAQLTGTPANVAIPNPNRPDGSYVITNIINWNVTKSPGGTPTEIGNFQPLMGGPADDPVPGIPGTGLTGNPRFENITAEIFAYLDLPAGYQKFGVNGDDGCKVQIGTPGQTGGPILFTQDRAGGSADFPFAFTAPTAGLYPVRLVWYQGGGGGNVEFFTYGPNNTKIPINDPTNPNAIKAYYNARVTAAPQITSATVSGGIITVVWINGGILESAPDITGPWTSTGDGDGSFSQAATANQRFYRVRSFGTLP